MAEQKKVAVGTIAHYYPKIGVAVVELKKGLDIGDEILIEGPSSSVMQTVESMQIEHKQIQAAKAKQSIGLKVNDKVHEGDTVYKLSS